MRSANLCDGVIGVSSVMSITEDSKSIDMHNETVTSVGYVSTAFGVNKKRKKKKKKHSSITIFLSEAKAVQRFSCARLNCKAMHRTEHKFSRSCSLREREREREA